jgi:hypothetical protein
MTRDSPPQVWPTPIIVAFAAFCVADFWIGYRNPLLLLMSIVIWPFICVSLFRGLTTELTHEGASQMTLRGRTQIAWTQVEKVSRNGGSCWISGKGCTLLLWWRLFENPDAARVFIDKHLPADIEHERPAA